jgi:hypothetical protein
MNYNRNDLVVPVFYCLLNLMRAGPSYTSIKVHQM